MHLNIYQLYSGSKFVAGIFLNIFNIGDKCTGVYMVEFETKVH